jgi:hypothetical protein
VSYDGTAMVKVSKQNVFQTTGNNLQKLRPAEFSKPAALQYRLCHLIR